MAEPTADVPPQALSIEVDPDLPLAAVLPYLDPRAAVDVELAVTRYLLVAERRKSAAMLEQIVSADVTGDEAVDPAEPDAPTEPGA